MVGEKVLCKVNYIINRSKNKYSYINNMASTSISEPVVVLYKSSACTHCRNLTNIWDDVTSSLKSVYPKLRFYVLTAHDNTGKFDENVAPKYLIKYGKWFPMIILVPGKVWDAAMGNLGPKNPIEIKEGVQIMNAAWDKDDLKYIQKYDIRKPAEFSKWLKDSLENEDFKRVQAAGPAAPPAGPVVPTSSTPSAPIQPLLSGIMRPTNSHNSYVAAGNTERNTAMEPGGDICSMRIISRPR